MLFWSLTGETEPARQLFLIRIQANDWALPVEPARRDWRDLARLARAASP